MTPNWLHRLRDALTPPGTPANWDPHASTLSVDTPRIHVHEFLDLSTLHHITLDGPADLRAAFPTIFSDDILPELLFSTLTPRFTTAPRYLLSLADAGSAPTTTDHADFAEALAAATAAVLAADGAGAAEAVAPSLWITYPLREQEPYALRAHLRRTAEHTAEAVARHLLDDSDDTPYAEFACAVNLAHVLRYAAAHAAGEAEAAEANATLPASARDASGDVADHANGTASGNANSTANSGARQSMDSMVEHAPLLTPLREQVEDLAALAPMGLLRDAELYAQLRMTVMPAEDHAALELPGGAEESASFQRFDDTLGEAPLEPGTSEREATADLVAPGLVAALTVAGVRPGTPPREVSFRGDRDAVLHPLYVPSADDLVGRGSVETLRKIGYRNTMQDLIDMPPRVREKPGQWTLAEQRRQQLRLILDMGASDNAAMMFGDLLSRYLMLSPSEDGSTADPASMILFLPEYAAAHGLPFDPEEPFLYSLLPDGRVLLAPVTEGAELFGTIMAMTLEVSRAVGMSALMAQGSVAFSSSNYAVPRWSMRTRPSQENPAPIAVYLVVPETNTFAAVSSCALDAEAAQSIVFHPTPLLQNAIGTEFLADFDSDPLGALSRELGHHPKWKYGEADRDRDRDDDDDDDDRHGDDDYGDDGDYGDDRDDPDAHPDSPRP